TQQYGIHRLQHEAPSVRQPALKSAHIFALDQKDIFPLRIGIQLLRRLPVGRQIPNQEITRKRMIVAGCQHGEIPIAAAKSKKNLTTELVEELIVRNQTDPHL